MARQALLGLVAGLSLGCQSLFFHPLRQSFPVPGAEPFRREDLFIESEDGVALHAWFLQPPRKPLGAILFLHGNAENLTTHVNSVLWLVQPGHQVLALDYRGYGRSEGRPDLDGVHRDARAALAALFARPDVDPGRVVVLGQSLGGSIAVHTVATALRGKDVRLLVVDSAFAGFRRIARVRIAALIVTWPLQYPMGFFFDDRYSAERWIAKVNPVPVLILHGGVDPVVPVGHARILHEKALEPKGLWIVQDEGHIGAFRNPDLRKRLLAALEDATEGRLDVSASPP